MNSIDKSRQFVPLNVAVLTMSDTRSLADDKSGDTLAARIEAAGHWLAAREHRRGRSTPSASSSSLDRGRRRGRRHLDGRHRCHRSRRDAGGDWPLFEKRIDGFAIAFHMLTYAKIGTSTIQSRATRAWRARPSSSVCRARPAPAATAGTGSWPFSSISGRGPATSSRSCRGWTSTCAGRKPKARQPDRLTSTPTVNV